VRGGRVGVVRCEFCPRTFKTYQARSAHARVHRLESAVIAGENKRLKMEAHTKVARCDNILLTNSLRRK
jgi:hypothetical protein